MRTVTMTSHPNPSERDLELLSAYLDGELSNSDRHVLEQRLAADGDLRRTLDELRATVRLVGSLPRLRAPRSFALDPVQFQRRAPWWERLLSASMALQLTGALGTAASIILIVVGLAVGGRETPPLEDAAAPSATLGKAPAAASLPTALPMSPTVAPITASGASEAEADDDAEEAADAGLFAEESAAELAPDVMPAPPSSLGDGAAETFAAPEAFMAPDAAAPQMDTFEAPAQAETLRSGEIAADSAPAPESQIGMQAPSPFPMPTGTFPAPEEGMMERFAGADEAGEASLKDTAEANAIIEHTPPAEPPAPAETDESTARPWLIGVGAAGLAISALLLLLGRRQAGA